MAIDGMVTLGCVAKTKRVPKTVLDHFARELTQWVAESCDGNQSRAARVLGVSQGHVSAMMSGDRGPGLNAILALREQTGKSLDELLGVGPPPAEQLTERYKASLEMDVARSKAQAKLALEEARVMRSEAERLLKLAHGLAEKRPTRRKGA
jgi:predicted transcriptional regulator